MQRREALRILGTGTALQFAPRSLLMALAGARMQLSNQATQHTLNPHQSETVKAMTEMILPRTETPGAGDVGASEFIDLILTEWCDDRSRSVFLDGLADVDLRSNTLFGKPFTGCPPIQQSQILIALGEKMVEETTGSQLPFAGDGPDDKFYPMLRRLTLTAYYTSEAGATQELHYEIIPDRHAECEPAPSGREAIEPK
jgi:Gluconate 2-dehydrogenase subunit 3